MVALPLWGPLYSLHGSQEPEVFDGSAESEYEVAPVVGCGEGL